MIEAPTFEFVLVKKFCEITGDTPQAVRSRLAAGVWTLGDQLTKDQLGRLHVNVEAYNRWVKEGQPVLAASKPSRTASASGSPTTESAGPTRSGRRRRHPTFAELQS